MFASISSHTVEIKSLFLAERTPKSQLVWQPLFLNKQSHKLFL